MKLRDVANPNPAQARFMGRGWENTTRMCEGGLRVRLVDPCSPDERRYLMGSEDREATTTQYHVEPFGIEVDLSRSVMCERVDDAAWLEAASADAVTLALGVAMVDPIVDTDSWVGGPGVREVPLAANPTPAQRGAAAATAWTTISHTTLDPLNPPIMHVPPSLIVPMMQSGVLTMPAPGEPVSVWGGPVVIEDGYDVRPVVFFTRTPDVYVSLLEGFEQRAVRLNDGIKVINAIGAIDVPPCAIVRVGALPARINL